MLFQNAAGSSLGPTAILFYSTRGADWRTFRVRTPLRDADRPPTVFYLRREVRFAPDTDWHGQSDESLVPLRAIVLRSTNVTSVAVPPGVFRPMYITSRDTAML